MPQWVSDVDQPNGTFLFPFEVAGEDDSLLGYARFAKRPAGMPATA